MTTYVKHIKFYCIFWQCLKQDIVPKYANIKVAYTSPVQWLHRRKYRRSVLIKAKYIIKFDVFDARCHTFYVNNL